MKRKKWSEMEEQTLLSKYFDLVQSGALSKLKTREKKFKPIADHVNSQHHLQDPISFPFKWTWRDISIKIQNMRHQYLGVKQKIRISTNEFNWDDGETHWDNFLKYKQVFGDIQLSDSVHNVASIKNTDIITDVLGSKSESVDDEEKELGDEDEEKSKKGHKITKLRVIGNSVLQLRDIILRRELKRCERELLIETASNRRCRNEITEEEMGIEEMQLNWLKGEAEKRLRAERESGEEKRRRMRMEEKLEEEEMELKERMIEMQIEHEKQMMQIQADAVKNQVEIVGNMTRLVCRLLGSTNDDALGGAV